MLFEIEIGVHANKLVMPGLAAFAKASAGQHWTAPAKPLDRRSPPSDEGGWRSRDPASIHLRKKFHSKRMDCRVKPGNDE
jgi:hypothetical protein